MLALTQLQPRDAKALLAFYNSVKGSPCSAWTENYPGVDDVLGDLARGASWACVENGRIIGAISWEEDEVLLTDCPVDRSLRSVCVTRVSVARDHQGRGMAKELVAAFLPILKAQGIQAARLLVSTENPAAQKTYAACGFHVVGACHMFDQDFICEEKLL